MRVLGVDPGTVVLGYGVVDEVENRLTLVEAGVISLSSRHSIEKRLSFIYQKLMEIIARVNPDEAAIEEPFVALNVRSALAIGRAQAVAMLAATIQGLPLRCYSPTKVKQHVTGYGASSKEQVAEMVRIHLGTSQPLRTGDTTDALAVAICHIGEIHLSRLASRSS